MTKVNLNYIIEQANELLGLENITVAAVTDKNLPDGMQVTGWVFAERLEGNGWFHLVPISPEYETLKELSLQNPIELLNKYKENDIITNY